ncbi:hypothetical protein L4D77_15165 [Photobacterium frigidiphilum]|uniref:hypothetical protein n=1 Tax=Photobacterium frigidiphilum TaxID=264736 RepID=UPI003D150339
MWQLSTLTWPHCAQDIQTEAESVTHQIGITLTDALSRLTALESDAQYGRHPLSLEASALLGLRGDLDALLHTGTVLTVSPYQFQVGTQVDSGQYLNPKTAVTTLANKLRDHADKYRPHGHVYCVVVMVTASQLGAFAKRLTDLVSVLPLPDWCQVARQAMALARNDIEKRHQLSAIIQPRFSPSALLNINPLRETLFWQGAQLATLESLADDTTHVIGKLQALSSKRTTKLTEVHNQLTALKNLKGSVWTLSLSGSAENIATQISQAGAPNNHPFTVASVMLSHEPMTFFKALLC